MQETFLQYLWQYKKFVSDELKTIQGDSLIILYSGENREVSPFTFFNVHLVLDGQKWAGNVGVYLKNSDWKRYYSEREYASNNTILHVVYEYDESVSRKDGSEVPVLLLKDYLEGYVYNESLDDFHQCACCLDKRALKIEDLV
ncbi:DUF2851 family protein [Flavobacterium sp. SM15]|uniref:DUF2851 family protein n=1 Tax=Flavobacterium sp. SM15 TaxID=2908005 RepID=UPI001EDA167F|nr:DUF2851 family protein [Flavobacterium sp. SM15]MCG2610600.1 DUF2851 family protein [Flavobacterium sp. SM15]